ncbi:uncharacterized protein TOT_030000444 [Theileria orientalis strain Shintoku]|uniref:Uncharacterized protein n=1 Tax=Theileria orientalis strain Shintoku TaxID=869250 RepID=J4C3X2_THEOR|nr:uncharacterized protein TOT_030000444 [Theileria orientalis strain Shintoku]BAM41181.1 uncharacterized protein TOT_030000444 [Theileria orientalis strain Shintoku]|eukprot:XP_009691482.1 uncharacterized protein TOT_030000444 [Theileria orientalis strain Shintoku]
MSSSLFPRQIKKPLGYTINNLSKTRGYLGVSHNFVNGLNYPNGLNNCTISRLYKPDVNYFCCNNQFLSFNFSNYRIRFFSTGPEHIQDSVDAAGADGESQDNLLNAVKAYSTQSGDNIKELAEELGIESDIGKEKLSLEELYEIPDYQEYLLSRITEVNGTKRSALQEFLPVDYLQQMFMAVHDYTNLSWAATICVMTLFFKLVSLPIWSNSERIRRMNAHLMPRAMELQEKANHAFATKNEKLARETQRQIFEMTRENSFMKGMLVQMGSTAFQGLMFGTVYGGLRLFAINPTFRPDFTFESCLWLDSLCLPDPYFILPSIFGILMTIVFEHNLSVNFSATEASKGTVVSNFQNRQKYMKLASRIGIIFFTFYGFTMPSSAFFYLIPSFLFQTILRYSCNRFEVARFLGIPMPIVKKAKPPKP